MGETARTFLALRLPAAATAQAETLLGALRPQVRAGDVKWVAPANLHVTLRFLGDLAPPAVERARALVGELDGAFPPLPTAFAELGAFPSLRRVQVIWLGLADGGGGLRSLAQEVEARLRRDGFGRADKRFVAHVTLGRVRRGRRVSATGLGDGLTTPDEAFSIREIVLYRSRLTPAGPEYSPLETARAGGV